MPFEITADEFDALMKYHEEASQQAIQRQKYDDVRYHEGEFRPENEIVARVNSLGFKRKPGLAKMEISVASVKRKDAANTAWQNFKGGLKGVAANLFLKPATIEPIGAQAMFDFGLALETGASSFTFPRARNLKAEPEPAH